jgi:diguanylate cyclase (GGDEF)-like protein
VFCKDVKVPDFPSLLIFPLEAGGESLGALCLGSPTPKAFDSATRALCEILAQQAAQTLLQIQHVELLNQLATTDGLTGLVNRRVFFERLSEEVKRSRRYPNTVSLLVIDVDHFKKINDRLGHPAGDEVLKKVAGALNRFARETDVVARHGGEEFALLLPNTTEAGAQAVGERIRQGVEALRVEWEGKTISVKVSIGVTSLEKEEDTAETLVARADQSLYAAKETGRNRVISYSEIREYNSWK